VSRLQGAACAAGAVARTLSRPKSEVARDISGACSDLGRRKDLGDGKTPGARRPGGRDPGGQGDDGAAGPPPPPTTPAGPPARRAP